MKATVSEARRMIRDEVDPRGYLEWDGEGKHFCCPVCDTGKGEHGSANTRFDEQKRKLFCFMHDQGNLGMDVIDIYQAITGTGFMTAVRELAPLCGIDEVVPDGQGRQKDPVKATEAPAVAPTYTDTTQGRNAPQKRPETATRGKTAPAPTGQQQNGQGQRDWGPYLRQCADRLQHGQDGQRGRDYLTDRGISLETAAKLGWGYDPVSSLGGENVPRIIFPDGSAFQGRAIDKTAPTAKRFPSGAKACPMNEGAIWTAEDVLFLTEGPFDAASIMEAGFDAIAIMGTGNAKTLIKQLEEQNLKGKKPGATMLLCFDTDKAGEDCRETLRNGFRRLGIPCVNVAPEICRGRKDPNEALQKDREAFLTAVTEAARKGGARPYSLAFYMAQRMAEDIVKYAPVIPTGFRQLDKLLSGGLRVGLYVVPAVSSLGKTTLVHQIADNIARSGTDVLFFSLEMSCLEMVSKSIARRMAQENIGDGVTSLQIRMGKALKTPGVMETIEAYQKDTAGHMNMIEGCFSLSAEDVAETVRLHVARTGARPVVIADYLQILAQSQQSVKQGIREAVDDSVKTLKQLSRDMSLPVVCVSSVGRSNYLTPISFESLKESGLIEFSADVVLGLQFACLDEALFSETGKITEKRERIEEARGETPRKISLRCLKNRFGRSPWGLDLYYYPAVDLFEETPAGAMSDFAAEASRALKTARTRQQGRKRK